MVLDRGFAYESGGSVYFDVSKFESFGALSHYSDTEMLALADADAHGAQGITSVAVMQLVHRRRHQPCAAGA